MYFIRIKQMAIERNKDIMKKIIAYLIIASICLFTCSCEQVDVVYESDTGIDATNTDSQVLPENNEIEIVESETERENIIYSFESLIYDISEGSSIFEVEDAALIFQTEEYIDNNAKQTMEIKLLGNRYNFIYDYSRYDPIYDQYYNIYKAPDVDNGLAGLYPPNITVDGETGHIARYSYFPYSSMPQTESECIALVKEIIGDAIDLDEYVYTMKTSYYQVSENAMGRKTAEGFYICKENEQLIGYDVVFSKTVDGITTTKQILGYFYKNMFSFNVFLPEYDDNIFGESMKNTDVFEKSIFDSLSDKICSEYVISDYRILSKRLFVNNDTPYVLSNVEVQFKIEEDDDVFYTTMVALITKIIAEKN